MDITEVHPSQVPHAWRDKTMYLHKGPIIIYHTHNQEGHTSLIGSARLPKVPDVQLLNYIYSQQSNIKSHGIRHWQRHVLAVNGHCGFGEKLAADDFGMSLTTRSVDGSMHPTGKHEQGLWVLDFPNLIDRVDLTGPLSGEEDETKVAKCVVIFAYIHLYENKRRRTILMKSIEEPEPARPQTSPNGKLGTHVKPPATEKHRLPPGATFATKKSPSKKRKSASSAASSTAGSVKQARPGDLIARNEAWKEREFPPLPAGKAPIWHKDGLSPFPEPDFSN